MNIKILEPLDENLVAATISFGSQVYGTADEYSDHDYVKIVKKDMGELLLQYSKSEGFAPFVDYIYTSERNFYALLDKGGNAVFFECAHLIPGVNILRMYNYENAKCYLGLAKRDLHYPERLWHVNRCLWMADKIMAQELIDLQDSKHVVARPVTFEEIAAKRLELNEMMEAGLIKRGMN